MVGITGATIGAIGAIIMGLFMNKFFLIFIGLILLGIGFLPSFDISSIPWFVWGIVILVVILWVIGKK